VLRIVHIRSRNEFRSGAELIELGSGQAGEELHLTGLPLVSVILDRDLPVGIPNDFLTHVALRSRSATGDTVRTYAEGLVSWLKFLKERGQYIEDATEERLALFRNNLANQTARDGRRKYASATVNIRVAVVEAFYFWGQQRRVLCTSLGDFLCTRNAEGRARVRGSWGRRRSADSLRIATMERMPRVLSHEEISRLFLVVRPPFDLMFRWALATGLRRFEVCALKRSLLPPAQQIAARGMDLVPVDMTRKGGKCTTVQAPAALVEETLWYCLDRRPSPAASEYSDYVFLSRLGIPYSRGSITREFRRCADLIGTDATLHHLRHTFATLTLAMLESMEARGRPMNSIKTLQVLLGHSNVTTTEVYLRALDVSSENVREALDFLYGATL